MTKIRMALAAGGFICACVATIAAFFYGQHIGVTKCLASQVETVQESIEQQDAKNERGLAEGIKSAQQAQNIDITFRKLRSDYRHEKSKTPDVVTGCVLDPVSLRAWNAANTGRSSGVSTSTFDDRMRGTTSSGAGTKRGGKPHRDDEHFSQVQGKSARVDQLATGN